MIQFEPEFRVIETLRWSVCGGPQRLERHLARMAQTCSDLGISFPAADLEAYLQSVVAPHDLRLRLTVDANGQAALEHWPFAAITKPWSVAIAPQKLSSSDPWLTRKTTRRALYDETRKALPAGLDEWLFVNERGEICEGTITNVFVKQSESDVLLTPPISCGLLPGVLRAELLDAGLNAGPDLGLDAGSGAELGAARNTEPDAEQGTEQSIMRAVEAILTVEDLQTAEAIFCGNSLRGLIPCQLVPSPTLTRAE